MIAVGEVVHAVSIIEYRRQTKMTKRMHEHLLIAVKSHLLHPITITHHPSPKNKSNVGPELLFSPNTTAGEALTRVKELLA